MRSLRHIPPPPRDQRQACSLLVRQNARPLVRSTRPPSAPDVGVFFGGELHTAYTFAVQRTPRGQPASALVVLERRGSPAAWAYLACPFPHPTRVFAGAWEARLIDGDAAHQGGGGLGGPGGSRTAVGAASTVVELWALPVQQQQGQQQQQSGQRQHGRVAGGGARAAFTAGAAPGGLGSHGAAAPELLERCGDDAVGEDSTARWVAEVLLGLHEHGAERLRVVGSVGVANRERLAREGVPGVLRAMRAAGCVVVDLAGVLSGPGDGGARARQGGEKDGAGGSGGGAQGTRQDGLPGGAGVGVSGAANGVGGRGAVQNAAVDLEAWEEEARRRLAAVEGSSGGAERSGVLCGLVEGLAGTWPEVQVLLLPALVPPTGRWAGWG